MEQVSAREMRSTLSTVLDRVEAGEEIVITRLAPVEGNQLIALFVKG